MSDTIVEGEDPNRRDFIHIAAIAAGAGTIGYELVCSITRRVRFVEA